MVEFDYLPYWIAISLQNLTWNEGSSNVFSSISKLNFHKILSTKMLLTGINFTSLSKILIIWFHLDSREQLMGFGLRSHSFWDLWQVFVALEWNLRIIWRPCFNCRCFMMLRRLKLNVLVGAFLLLSIGILYVLLFWIDSI